MRGQAAPVNKSGGFENPPQILRTFFARKTNDFSALLRRAAYGSGVVTSTVAAGSGVGLGVGDGVGVAVGAAVGAGVVDVNEEGVSVAATGSGVGVSSAGQIQISP